MFEIICGDCRDELPRIFRRYPHPYKDILLVSDPPFNVGYHYGGYADRLSQDEYDDLLATTFAWHKSVIIHYPEALYRYAARIGRVPTKVVSWVYNANTPRQHRDVAFFGVKPDFRRVRQPYKNPTDKRIRELLKQGAQGAQLYDWWFVNQVKNISSEKTGHPCQIPVEVMENIIGILPTTERTLVVDPFAGSGTTGVACKKCGVDFIGIELDSSYATLAAERIEAHATQLSANYI